MSTQADRDTLRRLVRSGDYDQARAMLRADWDGLFLDLIADTLTATERCTAVALATVATGGGVFSWDNDTGGAVLVRVVIDILTATSGACTIDIGVAASATTSSDTLMDGLNANAGAGVYSSIEHNGTNGRTYRRVTTSQFVTASLATGALAGLDGWAYIFTIPAED